MNTTAFFNFAATPAGQAFITAAMQIGGTIVQDIAAIVAAHAQAVTTAAVKP